MPKHRIECSVEWLVWQHCIELKIETDKQTDTDANENRKLVGIKNSLVAEALS